MPVIQMGFDVSGLRQGAEDARRQLGTLERQVDELQKALEKAQRSMSGDMGKGAFSKAGAAVADFKGKVSDLGGAFKALGIAAVAASVLEFQKACLQASMAMESMEQAYKSIFGGSFQAPLDVVKEQSQKVGQNFLESAKSAKTFFAAASNTTLAPQMNDIYKAVSNAGAAMHLSSEEMNGVFLALGQMVSKGKVQAEELRGQLGERLPGAFKLAADAMGMTTAELDDFMAKGNLTAEDLLPKLAKVLQDKFAASAIEAADTVQGQLNRMLAAWEEFKANLAASGPAVYVMRFITERLEVSNTLASQGREREAAIKRLESRGVKKGDDKSQYGVVGWFMSSTYTNEQIQGEIDAETRRSQEAAAKKQAQIQADKAKSDGKAAAQKASESFAKEIGKTKAGKMSALDAKRGSLTSQYKSGRAGMVANGASAEDLAKFDAQYKSAMKAVEDQFNSLAGKAGGGGKKKGGGGGSGIDYTARYGTSLEKMRNDVEALEKALDPTLTTYDRMVAKINAEKEAAIKNADVKARETVMRKQATQAQAEEMAGLEKRKAELTAQQKLDELSLKTLRDKAAFYKEFSELSGDMGQSIALQNQLIDQQAKEWTALGIPLADVQERVRLMKLEISDNPMDGLILGLHKYAADTESLAKTMGNAVSQAFGSMEDAFVQFATTGKMSFSDMANSIIADLMRIAMRSLVLGPIANALGGALGSLFGGGGSALSSGNLATMSANGMVSSGGWGLAGIHGHATGSVFSGLHGYANQIVTRPTLFAYGSRLTRFARGGVMGEAGPEAVMPLTRMGNGNLGVQAAGGGVMELSLTIVDRTQGGVGVEDAQASQGGLKLDVIVQQIDSKLAGLAASGKSKLVGAMEKTHRMPSTRGWS